MKKIALITLLAGLTTFGLFAFMAFLISSDHHTYIEPGDVVVVEVVKLPDEKPAEIKPKVKFTPPPPPPEMLRTNIVADNTEVSSALNYSPTGLKIAQTTPSIGTIGRRIDGDAKPVVRVNPKYPIIAARDGIEGWVVLAFDINAIGEVINIKIIDSQPKRVFDKAAKQALKRWKYRAKSINGKQVEQRDFTVQLDFTMSQES